MSHYTTEVFIGRRRGARGRVERIGCDECTRYGLLCAYLLRSDSCFIGWRTSYVLEVNEVWYDLAMHLASGCYARVGGRIVSNSE